MANPGVTALKIVRDMALVSLGLKPGDWERLGHGDKILLGQNLCEFLTSGTLPLRVTKANDEEDGLILLSRRVRTPREMREVADQNARILDGVTSGKKVIPWWSKEYQKQSHREKVRCGILRMREKNKDSQGKKAPWGMGRVQGIEDSLRKKLNKRVGEPVGLRVKKRKDPTQTDRLVRRLLRRNTMYIKAAHLLEEFPTDSGTRGLNEL
jgi:hypothetical protein